MEEAPEESKAKRSRLLGESLVVDTLKPSTRGSMIKSYGTFEGEEELFLSSLIDFHSFPVCFISTDVWERSLELRQLGVKYAHFMPLSKLASLQLKGLGGRIDNIPEV